jgi:transketolase
VRQAFVNTLMELAERDPRVMLLTGDLGFMALEPFAQQFPRQFINMGVAEQNMIGVATGLAEGGFIPFCYSIVTFATLRGYEFIRNGPLLHHLPVRIIGMGGGFEYGHAGPTHHGLEDIAVMRAQPGMTVIAPADSKQTRTALLSTWDMAAPVYYRLGKNDKAEVKGLNGRFAMGEVEVVRAGKDILILSMGSIGTEAVRAGELLATRGIEATVAVVASISPPPLDDLHRLLARFPAALTVEAHYLVGGLGSLVSEVVAGNGFHCQVTRCGVVSLVHGLNGSEEYLKQLYGLKAETLAETAQRVLHELGIKPESSPARANNASR